MSRVLFTFRRKTFIDQKMILHLKASNKNMKRITKHEHLPMETYKTDIKGYNR